MASLCRRKIQREIQSRIQLQLVFRSWFSTVNEQHNHYDLVVSGGGIVGLTLGRAIGKLFGVIDLVSCHAH